MKDSLREPKRIGSPIVALHSFASAKSQWDQLQKELEEKAQVLAIDLPGSNSIVDLEEENSARSELTIEHIREKIGSDKNKMHLVGHSNAGSTALKLALRYPEAFESITVYEPTVFHIAGVENRIGNKLRQEFELMKEMLVESKSNGGFDAGIKEFWKFWDDTEFWEQFSSDDQKEFSRKIGIVMSDIERCFSEKWSLEDLRGLNIPVQVIMGMQSPLVFQNLAVQIVSALPAGRLTTLPMYGHFAPITHSEVINPLIIEHISDVEQRQKKKGLGVNYPNKEQVKSNPTEVGLLNRIRKSSFSFFA